MKILRFTEKAFTLLELLTVVAILGILASLASVGLSRARKSGQSAACLGHLRQLASACQIYSAENDGVLIPICTGTGPADAKTWRKHLEPYIGSEPKALNCPAEPAAAVEDIQNRGTRPPSYGINKSNGLHEYLNGKPNKRVGQVVSPAKTIFMADIALVTNPSAPVSQWVSRDLSDASSYGYARFPNDPSFSGGDPWNVFPRHNGRANVVFYDGHAASVDVQGDLIAHPPGDPLCLYDNL